jgi:transcriptional regulator with XRE-family HTH domain
MNTTEKAGHIGRKISKIRELRGMKQEALAFAIGVSQQTVSNIENSETVEETVLQKVADALEVTVEGIKNFSEEAVLNIIGNTYNVDNSSAVNYGCTFNPLDKVIALFEEKEKLYERLLKAEQDKVTYLERLMAK